MTRANQAVPNREYANESSRPGPAHSRVGNSTDLDLDLIPDCDKLRNAQIEGMDTNISRNPSKFAEGNNDLPQDYIDDEGYGTYGSKRFNEDHINVPQPNVDRPAKAQTITPITDN